MAKRTVLLLLCTWAYIGSAGPWRLNQQLHITKIRDDVLDQSVRRPKQRRNWWKNVGLRSSVGKKVHDLSIEGGAGEAEQAKKVEKGMGWRSWGEKVEKAKQAKKVKQREERQRLKSKGGVCNCHPEMRSLIVARLSWPAGMRDRWWIIRHLSDLAARYCAKLYIPPPCTALISSHNGGKAVSCDLDWSHYVNVEYTYKHRNQSIMTTDVNLMKEYKDPSVLVLKGLSKPPPARTRFKWVLDNLDPGEIKRYLSTHFLWPPRSFEDMGAMTVVNCLKTGYAEKVQTVTTEVLMALLTTSTSGDQSQDCLDTGEPELCRKHAATCSQPSHKQYRHKQYRIQRELCKQTCRLCGGSRIIDSSGVIDEDAPFFAIHLRRGDLLDPTWQGCNTTTAAVHDFIACVVNGAPGIQQHPWFIFSDEESKTYQSEVMESLAGLHIQARFVDAFILEFLKKSSAYKGVEIDNYLVFAVGSLIQTKAVEFFELGHLTCPGGSDLGANCAAAVVNDR
jgi:hypothetical protein